MSPNLKNSDEVVIRHLNGTELAHPKTGDEIVISGISGQFPDSDNMEQFNYNLMNKIDMVTSDDRRWKLTHPEIPKKTGKINNVTKYDAGYFGIHHKQATSMDPMLRLLFEKTYECILDAGVNPSDFRGKNIGVFIGTCFSESEKTWFYERVQENNFGFTGCARSMIPQKISYWLGVNGPSYVIDGACSSSLYALEHAYRAVRNNLCESALVGGCNLCLHPYVSLQFSRLGVLSKNGTCKSFDENADGYARSETMCMIYVQKSRDAKRVYATIIHAKTNCDGYKETGITFPSAQMQLNLYEKFYEECNIDPKLVALMEAHGTGTKAGDPEELTSIDKIFCSGRSGPLPICSVKSNIGHTEPASGLCSVAKVIIAMEEDIIPPNINFNTPRLGVEGFEEKRLKVVTDKTIWNGGLVGVNSFGFGGANCHVLLKSNEKSKNIDYSSKIPYLVCYSGRNLDYIKAFGEHLKSVPLDPEFVKLLHDIHKTEIHGHSFRSFIILSPSTAKSPKVIQEKVLAFSRKEKMKLTLILNDKISDNWKEIWKNFNKIDIFSKTMKICREYYDFKKDITPVVALLLIHIGIINIFKKMNVHFSHVYGVSIIAKLSALYCKKSMTLKDFFKLVKILENDKNYPMDQYLHKSEKFLDADNLKAELEDNIVIVKADNVFQRKKMKFFSIKCNESMLAALGEIYLIGSDLKLEYLYPSVKYPVSRKTKMIAPLVRWNHSEDWFVTFFNVEQKISSGERLVRIDLSNDEFRFFYGHNIDGRNLFPATGYLEFVWETLSLMNNRIYTEMPIVFENVKFLRATNIPKEMHLEMTTMIHKDTGNFEIIEGGVAIVTGNIKLASDVRFYSHNSIIDEPDNDSRMSSKDIYKELKLRGYFYQDLFRGLKECNLNGTWARVKWNNNWTTFMDNMMQLQILQLDSRNLLVPIGFKKLIINPYQHYVELEKNGDEHLSMYAFPKTGIVRSGGVELIGLEASSIPRRKSTAEPVLESYEFVPHIVDSTSFSLKNTIRNFVQIALENIPEVKVKTAEIFDISESFLTEPISEMISNGLGDLPLIQSETNVLTIDEKKINIDTTKKINIIDFNKVKSLNNCLLVTVTFGLSRDNSKKFLTRISSFLKDEAFIISREKTSFSLAQVDNTLNNFLIIQEHANSKEKLFLLRKKSEKKVNYLVEYIHNDDFTWISRLQVVIENLADNDHIILVSEKDSLCGILGFVNCLRKEIDQRKISCFFITNDSNLPLPMFDQNLPFYKSELIKNLIFNVYKNGVWGTYRHLEILKREEELQSECFHSYVNTLVRGDLSSLTWIQGSIEGPPKEITEVLVNVQYSALNFRDIMTSTGKLNVEVLFSDRMKQECVQGLEFSGFDDEGRRVMGIVSNGGLSTVLYADKLLLWKVPDHWTLEDAATVPIVYATCLTSLLMVGRIKKGNSILIHAGSGGIGQAAIHLCLYYGLTIFTTVGTLEKREFIRKTFPQIPEKNIGNSRDISFEKMVMVETNNRGVDFILNSLAEDKLQASVRCLAPGGKFLEIGKFDLSKDNKLSTEFVKKGCSFSAQVLDALFDGSPEVKQELSCVINEGLKNGSIKPLSRTTFENHEIEKAFRFMAAGKHVGKVLIKIRNENATQSSNFVPEIDPKILSKSRFYPKSEASVFILVGGLGGFGLELADWLVVRGVKNLVLTSRYGVVNGYQKSRIKCWKNYGVRVQVYTNDINSAEECNNLIRTSEKLGPVEGIFNLAVVLKDSFFQNQTAENFEESLKPKAYLTKHLDHVTRILCGNLKYFVVFSSVSCGRGNAGQTNYGMANSIMERICEQRRLDGYPALAIEWGAIGDVGLVAEMQENDKELEISGTLQQKISSCLSVMDAFLLRTGNSPIVSSIVVAEKKIGNYGSDNIVDVVTHIMGIKDLKTISLNSTLAEIGMDSMMAVEIKQTLERDFEIFLNPQDIRSLTFGKLNEMSSSLKTMPSSSDSLADIQNELQSAVEDLKYFVRVVGEENEALQPIVTLSNAILPQNINSSDLPTILYLPSIEGVAKILKPLSEKIIGKNICLQVPYVENPQTIPEMVDFMMPYALDALKNQSSYVLIGYSYGSVLALEVASRLERLNVFGKIILIDGSPSMLKQLSEQKLNYSNDTYLQITLLSTIIDLFTLDDLTDVKKELLNEDLDMNSRVDFIINHPANKIDHSKDHQKNVCLSTYSRLKALKIYEPDFNDCIQSSILLIRPQEAVLENISLDYGIAVLMKQDRQLQVKFVEGCNHFSIVDNDHCAKLINDFVWSPSSEDSSVQSCPGSNRSN